MFLKDEYIVCLNTPIDNGFFPPNFVYKQKKEKEWLSVYHDIKGGDNGWVLVRFDRSEKYSEWRYATEEEVEEYELRGKPYDVTTLPKFILPKKWCCNITNEEEKETLNEFIKNNGYRGNLSHYYYIHYPLMNGGGSAFSKIQKGYIEITYSQFLKYVLGKEVIEVKDDLTSLKNLLEKIGIT